MTKTEIATLTPEYLFSLIKQNAGRIEELDRRTAKNSRGLKDIEEEYPLLPPEADDLSSAVRKKGVLILGGKKSPAYNDLAIRRTLYRDIYHEIKRQYGLIDEKGRESSYKKLKRKYLQGALIVVDEYEVPTHLANQIDALNEIEDMD